MKIYLVVLLILMSFCPYTYCNSNYALITDSSAKLYLKPEKDDSIKNIICVMEDTYYVEILHTYDENYYKVNYCGVTGYVLRQTVKRVDGTPKKPYPENVSLKTIRNNVYLRTTPEKSNNSLTIVPPNCTELKYIGYVYGEQVDDFRENIWYYVKYLDVYGYIYSEYVDSISPIPRNIEQLSFLNNDFDDIVNPLSNGTCVLLVIVLTLPTLLILYFLYRKPKPKRKFKERIMVVKEYDDKL